MTDLQHIIITLKSKEHFGVGENIEFAKGKRELIYSLSDFKNKIKRKWQSKER